MFRMTLLTDRKALPELIQGLTEFADSESLETLVTQNLCIIVEELFMNFLSHGSNPHGRMTVTIEREDDVLHIQTRDDGIAFDPCNAPVPDTQSPLTDRHVGGLGLHFVRHLANEITYHRDGECNIVDLRLLART